MDTSGGGAVAPLVGQIEKFMESSPHVHPLTRVAFEWLQQQPFIGALLLLMVMDIITGTLAAALKGRVSSTVSREGITRKVFVWFVVGAAYVVGQFTSDLPLAKLVAGFYLWTEALSILENVALAGVPLPRVLTDTLSRLKEATQNGASANGAQMPLVIERERVERHIYEPPSARPSLPTRPNGASQEASGDAADVPPPDPQERSE